MKSLNRSLKKKGNKIMYKLAAIDLDGTMLNQY